ncbi:hypothetical protein EVAR_58217_1 [Eumeta japonica]|uniref:Uncharacterized protein n=1 Tax=Eumeta variegata TaxID=151549 RepID=A0A4C1ZSB5_EUMVA|nr:hypothetical protein EVAR_58217_1 [Eumeta japonica]
MSLREDVCPMTRGHRRGLRVSSRRILFGSNQERDDNIQGSVLVNLGTLSSEANASSTKLGDLRSIINLRTCRVVSIIKCGTSPLRNERLIH